MLQHPCTSRIESNPSTSWAVFQKSRSEALTEKNRNKQTNEEFWLNRRLVAGRISAVNPSASPTSRHLYLLLILWRRPLTRPWHIIDSWIGQWRGFRPRRIGSTVVCKSANASRRQLDYRSDVLIFGLIQFYDCKEMRTIGSIRGSIKSLLNSDCLAVNIYIYNILFRQIVDWQLTFLVFLTQTRCRFIQEFSNQFRCIQPRFLERSSLIRKIHHFLAFSSISIAHKSSYTSNYWASISLLNYISWPNRYQSRSFHLIPARY